MEEVVRLQGRSDWPEALAVARKAAALAERKLVEMGPMSRSEKILLGTFVLSAGYYDAYYRKAQQVRTLLRRDFERAFERCDVVATPTTPTPAFGLGEKIDDPLQMYLADIFTVPAHEIAAVPVIVVGSAPQHSAETTVSPSARWVPSPMRICSSRCGWRRTRPGRWQPLRSKRGERRRSSTWPCIHPNNS